MSEFKIDNISILEYFQLEDTKEYDFYIEYMKPSSMFGRYVSRFKELTFDEVGYIKRTIQQPTVETIKNVFLMVFHLRDNEEETAEDYFFNQSIFDLFRCQKQIDLEIETIAKRESNAYQQRIDPKLIAIDAAKKLQPYQHQLSRMKVAEKYGKTPAEIGRWKYSEVFSILATLSQLDRINADYANQK